MNKTTRSILTELTGYIPNESKEIIIGNRANHIIESAVNLIELINKHYPPEQAEELQKKLFSSIKNKDSKRFERSIKKFKDQKEQI